MTRGAQRSEREPLLQALCAVLGAMLPLCFAPFGYWWLAPILLAGLFLCWDHVEPRTALMRGIAFGFAAFAAGTYWLYISMHDFGGAPSLLAVVLMLALFAVMALWIGGVGWLAARVAPAAGPVRWLLGLPAMWVLVEWLRGWVFTGFPWLSLGYGQIDGPLAGWGPIGGVYLMSWVTALLAGCAVCAVRGSARARVPALAVFVIIAAGSIAFGGREWTQPDERELDVALVQGAVSQDRKWLPAQYQPTLALYRNLSLSVAGADIVLWPEVAIPALASQAGGYLDSVARSLAAEGSHLALGILTRAGDTGQIQNSLVAPGEPRQTYHKRHLVPFGEYFPVPAFVREWMRMMSLPYSDIAAGERSQPLFELAGVPAAPAICYEDAYGAELLDFMPEARILLSISNDAWFGDSIAADQHLEIARVRALETGRPMLRATNTGITAIISARGEIESRLDAFAPGVLSGTVRPRYGHTPYTRLGNLPLVALALSALLAAVILGRSHA